METILFSFDYSFNEFFNQLVIVIFDPVMEG